MKSAGAGNTSGENLSSLGNKLSELCYVLVVDSVYFILAEDTNLLSSVHRTERGALSIISIHYNSPFYLSDSQFLYCSTAVSLTERGQSYPKSEGQALVVRKFFKISTGRTAECRSTVSIRGIRSCSTGYLSTGSLCR